jgi:hypothetical protein
VWIGAWDEVMPDSDMPSWPSLSAPERAAAKVLGYSAASWKDDWCASDYDPSAIAYD